MKKLKLLFLLLISTVIGFAQFPVNSPQSSPSTNNIFKGAISAQKGIVPGIYNDTTAANADTHVKTVPYIIITTRNGSIWQRNTTAKKWLLISTGTAQPCRGLQNGGIVTWTNGLSFNVTAAGYCINNNIYNSLIGNITLNAADITNPRIDVIGLDTNNNIIKITGIPNANPATPQVNLLSQLYLTSILVPAGSLVPSGVSLTTIYDENTEWATSGTSIDFNYLVNPFSGVKSTLINASTEQITYTNLTKIDLRNFQTLILRVKNNIAFSQNNLISFGFVDTVTTASTNRVDLMQYNFSTTNLAYQQIVIPVSDFLNNSNTYLVNSLYFKNFFTTIPNLQIDKIQLQSGIINTTSPYITDIFRKKATDSVFKVINGVSLFAFKDSTGGSGTGGNDSSYVNFTTTPDSSTLIFRKINGGRDTIVFVGSGTGGSSTPITLTTTGTSGASTLVGSALNIPNYATGGGGIPSGVTTNLQFNDAGSFGGTSTIGYNKTTGVLALGDIANPSLYSYDIDPFVVIARTINPTTNTNGHAFVDGSIFNKNFNGLAYNSFTNNVQYTGAANFDHYAAFQNAFQWSGTGVITNIYGMIDAPNHGGLGTITNRFGVNIFEATGLSAITNNYGVYVKSLTKGTARKYAFFSETTPSYFGGNITVGGQTGYGAGNSRLFWGFGANNPGETYNWDEGGIDNTPAFHGYRDFAVALQGGGIATPSTYQMRLSGKFGTPSLNIGITVTEDASAIFKLESTTQGTLLSRMTTTQRNAITSPTEGLEIYNLTTHTKDFWNGTVWKTITTN